MGIRGFQSPDGSDQPMGASGGFHVYLMREGSYTSLYGRTSVMAYLFLKAQGLAGKLVADIRIDGAGKKVTRSDNCRVSDLSVSSDNLTFTYEAKSLPYPIDTSYYDNEKHTQADA